MSLAQLDPAQIGLLGYILLAMILGALIGAEREFADKPAGLRTHMLVSGGSALLVGISTVAVDNFQPRNPKSEALSNGMERFLYTFVERSPIIIRLNDHHRGSERTSVHRRQENDEKKPDETNHYLP